MLEWDETKRLVNIQRRGLDFGDADLMFDGRPVTTAASQRNNEDRFISTAEINGNGCVDVATRKSAHHFIPEGG